ncbi:MAG: M48 family metallopeptidase [Anaerolineales bacterium]|nr:M48 family metallopeptidase [Anaerolineales bacterium]
MHQIIVNDLVVDVVRKDIKNLHVAVYPPSGRVRVAAPLRVDDEAVRLAVISKLGWIKRQQAKFVAQERQSAREYVSGESHYFQGNRYLLNVLYLPEKQGVVIRHNTKIELIVRPGGDTAQRERVMLAWYRRQLKEAIPLLFAKWEPVIGVEVADWGVRQMKTKWGSCNIEARRIWLNLELVKKPTQCLEYIIVHEMVHLLERHHNDRFIGLMDKFLPSWRLLRDELNREPLAHEHWDY